MPSKTNNQQISFVTTADVTLLAGQYYVLAPIEAEVAGVSGNVGTDTITLVISPVNVNGVTNIVATTGGQDQETNQDYARRLINVFKARNVGTVTGIRELALSQPNVIDCYVADVGDPVMVRDGGLGGKVDIYIQSESGFTDIVLNEQFVYSGSDYTFLIQPAISITSVYNVTTATDITGNTSLVKDIGTLKESTRATDKLHVISSAVPTDVLRVTYVYNKLLNDIQALMDGDAVHIAGIDDLVRSALETFIDVTGSIKIASGYVFGDVQTSIINQITTYIEAKEIASSIVYGDIINIIHDTPGVADLTPLTRLSRSTEFTNVTINLLGTEYPRAGTITITQFA
jgi:hypothetical protein